MNPEQRVDYWLALEEAQKQGLVKSIGVSNFGVAHMQKLIDDPRTTVVPAANEVELHPFLRQDEIEEFCKPRGIRLIAYSPLSRAKRLDNPVIQEVAKAHGATPAQIVAVVSAASTCAPTRTEATPSDASTVAAPENRVQVPSLE